MKKFGLIITVILIGTMLFSLAGCKSGTSNGDAGKDNQVITIKLAHDEALDTPMDKTSKKFKELVEAKTDGKIKVDIYPSGQLGTAVSSLEQVIMGTHEMQYTDINWLANWAADYNITSMSFLFEDSNHLQKYLQSEWHQNVKNELREKHGLRVLAENASRMPRVVVSKSPYEKPEDFVGADIRVPAIPLYLKVWEKIGANPVRIAWGETYLGLSQGLAQAADGPLDGAYQMKFHEVTDYVILTKHVYSAMSFVINENKFQTLSPDTQKALEEAAWEANEYFNSLNEKLWDEYLQELKNQGKQIIEIDADGFKSILVGLPEQFEAEGMWSEGLTEYVRALIK